MEVDDLPQSAEQLADEPKLTIEHGQPLPFVHKFACFVVSFR